MRSAIWTSALVWVLAGCAQGGGGLNPRGGDGAPGMDASRGTDGGARDDAATVTCDPPCISGEVCSDGACVSATGDMDGDGVAAAEDCDDTNPAVGANAARECSNECGTGMETCTDGVWGACDAPASCECAVGAAPRTIDCTQCGTQRQTCVDGVWTNDGACTGMGACAPGAMETDTESCGACGLGTQRRVRTCGTDCAWGPWMDSGSCSGGGGGECTPGETDTRTVDCGNCGDQRQTRTCSSSTCTWGSWSNSGSCTSQGVCSPGQTRTGCDRNSAGNPTPCGVQRCTSSCTWGSSCELAPGAACMSGMGTNYGCCTAPGGGSGWRFCNAGTCQWYACEAHSC